MSRTYGVQHIMITLRSFCNAMFSLLQNLQMVENCAQLQSWDRNWASCMRYNK